MNERILEERRGGIRKQGEGERGYSGIFCFLQGWKSSEDSVLQHDWEREADRMDPFRTNVKRTEQTIVGEHGLKARYNRVWLLSLLITLTWARHLALLSLSFLKKKMWKIIPASKERAATLLARVFVQIWKWLSLWVGELEKKLLLSETRHRDTGFGEEGMALLYKNKLSPLWQVVRRAEFRLVFRFLIASNEYHTMMHLAWGCVKTKSCPQKHSEGSPRLWNLGLVRELEREKRRRREERKEGVGGEGAWRSRYV